LGEMWAFEGIMAHLNHSRVVPYGVNGATSHRDGGDKAPCVGARDTVRCIRVQSDMSQSDIVTPVDWVDSDCSSRYVKGDT
jgi:hypothetical protein